MNAYFDSHAHLNDPRLQADISAVMARATEAGVSQIMCVGYDLETSRAANKIAFDFPEVFASVGVHPHHAASFDETTLHEVAVLAQSTSTVAIGEIGLDYYRNLSPQERQQSAFRRQLRLAIEINAPIIIHNRAAAADILAILVEEGVPEAGGVMHCFSETAEYADRIVGLGLHIGIAGPVTFSKSYELKEAVAQTPLERILIETDAPYLTPEPFRGRRLNEPANVVYIAEKIAKLKSIDVGEVARITAANASSLFRINDS